MTIQMRVVQRDYLVGASRSRCRGINRISLIVFLLLILICLAACASSNGTTISETAITPELDQVLEDYFAAFNEYDSDALQAVITDSYVLYEGKSFSNQNVSSPVCEDYDAVEMFNYLEGYNKAREYHFERKGEPIMSGKGPWLISHVIWMTWKDNPNGVSGISTLTVVDDGGTLKVARDVFIGFVRK